MVLVHPVRTSEKYQSGAKVPASFIFPLNPIHAATSGYLSGIKQWINTTSNTTITYPISYTTCWFSSFTPYDTNNEYAIAAHSETYFATRKVTTNEITTCAGMAFIICR